MGNSSYAGIGAPSHRPRQRATLWVAALGYATCVLGCGARTLDDGVIDEALLDEALSEQNPPSDPALDESGASDPSGEGSGPGSFPSTELPPCEPGPRYTREAPCVFMDDRLCYETQLAACACACRRTGGDTCSSEFPSSGGFTPALVYCPG